MSVVNAVQNDWVEMGIFATLVAILAVLVWYARAILRLLARRDGWERTFRAGQIQGEGHGEPDLAESEAPRDYAPAAEPEPQVVYGGVGRMLSGEPARAASATAVWPRNGDADAFSPRPAPQRTTGAARFERDAADSSLLRGVIRWLQAPMNPRVLVPWRRTIRQLS
jgi:hypothetical protein